MEQAEKLAILKKNLQRINNANDEYLEKLLDLSAVAISDEGIKLIEDDIQSDMAVIEYAAYLFRKRASENAEMPRCLRWMLNNMKLNRRYRK